MEARRRSAPYSGPASINGRQACNTCRVRKTKCDRAEPSCGRCHRLGQICTYDAGATTPQNHLAEQVRHLQERLAKAEARIIEQPSTVPSVANASTTASSPLANFTAPWPLFTQDHQYLPTSPPYGQVPSHNGLLEGPAGRPSTAGTPTQVQGVDVMDQLQAASLVGLENHELTQGLDWGFPALDFASQANSAMASSRPNTALSGETVPGTTIATLHQHFFTIVHQAWPFLNQDRFTSELTLRSDVRPVLALSYAVALLGSTVRAEYADLQTACYQNACRYAAACEKDDDEICDLNLFQALLLIIRYELTSQRIARAWLTLGRAVRLSNMLGLHRLDQRCAEKGNDLDLGIRLPETADELEMEERRRSFWGLYILQSYIDTRTESCCEFGQTKVIEVRLPAPGSLTSDFTPIVMPTLKECTDLSEETCRHISPYAGCVLMVDIAVKCFDHARQRPDGSGKTGFWDNHYTLTKAWNDRSTMLTKCLNSDTIKKDPISFSLHMNLCAAEILFHETTMDEAARQQLPPFVAAESQRRATKAAFKIASILRLNWPSRGAENDVFTIQATFVAWPLVMALKTMSRDLVASDPNAESDAVAHTVRTLLAALDHAESPDGHWHAVAAPAVIALQQWEERSGLGLVM